MRENIELGAVILAVILQGVAVWQNRRRDPPEGKHRR